MGTGSGPVDLAASRGRFSPSSWTRHLGGGEVVVGIGFPFQMWTVRVVVGFRRCLGRETASEFGSDAARSTTFPARAPFRGCLVCALWFFRLLPMLRLLSGRRGP